jgi:hypothetical protein
MSPRARAILHWWILHLAIAAVAAGTAAFVVWLFPSR